MKDKDLIQGLKRREELAFKILVEEYKDRIYNLCFGYIRNSSEAEDLTQEVFVTIYNSMDSFNEDATLTTWVYRIAINEALQMIRRQKAKKRWGFMSSLFGMEDKLGLHHQEHIHPGVVLENKERSQVLFKEIDQLSDRQRTAFLLNKVEGKSYVEVAEIMNMSTGAVESLLFRAKANLRKQLNRYYKETVL